MQQKDLNNLDDDQGANQVIIDYLCNKVWANRQAYDDCPVNSPLITRQ